MSTAIVEAASPPSRASVNVITVTAIGFRSDARIKPFIVLDLDRGGIRGRALGRGARGLEGGNPRTGGPLGMDPSRFLHHNNEGVAPGPWATLRFDISPRRRRTGGPVLHGRRDGSGGSSAVEGPRGPGEAWCPVEAVARRGLGARPDRDGRAALLAPVLGRGGRP